jgi:hypothetical protein
MQRLDQDWNAEEENARIVSLVRRPPRPNPKAALAEYLANIHPARRHGATDCGENLEGLSDADHMLQWLAERGLAVVGTKGAGR